MRIPIGDNKHMWAMPFRNRREGTCDHQLATATTNYGLTRTVCGTCGQVSLGYLHEAVESYGELGGAVKVATTSPEESSPGS